MVVGKLVGPGGLGACEEGQGPRRSLHLGDFGESTFLSERPEFSSPCRQEGSNSLSSNSMG